MKDVKHMINLTSSGHYTEVTETIIGTNHRYQSKVPIIGTNYGHQSMYQLPFRCSNPVTVNHSFI